MNLQEELKLVVQAKNGEKEAVTALWEDITPRLFGYLVNTLRDPALAEDILQETWLKAISGLQNFRDRGVRFSAWLFAIAKNECRQRWRKSGRETLADNQDSYDAKPADQDSLSEKIMIDGILLALSDEDRELLRLRYIADLSFKELSRVLGISIIAARVRVHRALGKARAVATKK